LVCDVEDLDKRFEESNEPKLVGNLTKEKHQSVLLNEFLNFGYKKNIVINTSINSIKESVDMILIELYNTHRKKQPYFYGDSVKTRNGMCKVISYKNSTNIRVIFKNTGYETKTEAVCLRKGLVKDRLAPTIKGIGYIGIGGYNTNDIAYTRWFAIINRCYGKNFCKNLKQPTVCKEWLNYQVFADWFHFNYIKNYEIDKDLKIYKNRHYSPDTCIFIPQKINLFFSTKIENKKILKTHGVKKTIYGFTPTNTKIGTVFYNEKEAMNEYWNEKYTKMTKLINEHKEYKELLENYFEQYFYNKYNEEL